jgi:hypothetical protein
MQTVENSYDLAAQHVIASLEAQTADLVIRFADRICVEVLQNFDCVPVQVKAGGWLWSLRSAHTGRGDVVLTANYRAVCLDPALTPDEDLAAKYRRELDISGVRIAGR